MYYMQGLSCFILNRVNEKKKNFNLLREFGCLTDRQDKARQKRKSTGISSTFLFVNCSRYVLVPQTEL